MASPKSENSPHLPKSRYEFKIGGLTFHLRSSHDHATVSELVEFVDSKIQQAMVATKSGSFQNAAVLAALNIAEELILLKKKAAVELDDLDQKLRLLSAEMENYPEVKSKESH